MGNSDLSKRPWLITGIVVFASILALVALVFGYFTFSAGKASFKSKHVERVAREEASRLDPDADYESKASGFIDCPDQATAGWFGGSSACIGGIERAFGFTSGEEATQRSLIQALKENGWASDQSNPPTSLRNIIKTASGDIYAVRWESYNKEEVMREFTRDDLRPEIRESWRRGYANEKAAFDSNPNIQTVISIHVSWISDRE